MRFLYCNDLHGRAKNSVNRLGNYREDWLNKVKETCDIADKKQCEFVICGGDLFDSNNVSNLLIDDFLDIVEPYNKTWYVVPGNHDEIGHSWELSKSTSLAHIIRRSCCFKKLEKETFENVAIKGFEYKHDIENDIKEDGLIVGSGKLRIAVPHAFITIKPFHPSVNHILAKDIETDANIILCSHFHENWNVHDIKNNDKITRFVNLGAFGRLSIGEAKHHPKVAVIDCESQEIDIINLMSAKPGHEVFDLSKYNETKENKKNIKDFLEKLNSIEWQSMDVKTQISKIGKEEKIDKEVIDYIFKKMGNDNE